MSPIPIHDLDQDYVILNTKVTVGKSYKSRGWALSRQDIHDWIPTEKFERDCKIVINNICSDAVLRFNPRLFYESDELSSYLEKLYDEGCDKRKIPMQIRINKNNLFSNIDSIEKYLDVQSIDTKLLVGKSYKSKGWQLSKDVVPLVFPSEYYDDEYLIYINNIESNAKLNFQFRLFYNSNELSEYLEELYYEIPKEKIPAKIIFESSSSLNENNAEKTPDVVIEDDNSESLNSKVCDICGKQYDNDSKLLIENANLSHFCPNCAEKIFILEKYNILKNSSFSNFTRKESVEELFGSNFNQIWDLLIEYGFLVPFGDLFKLNGNDFIEQSYSEFLSDETPWKKTTSKRNRSKILELINEDDIEEEDRCTICGNVLGSTEIEKCQSCNDKSLATEYLKNIVTLVPYGKNFAKFKLTHKGIDSLDLDLYLNKLVEYDLIIQKSNVYYKLNDVDFLNEFVGKYSESPYELQINYVNENSDIVKISKKDLSSEERIDSLIKWKNYGDFISFKKGQYGAMSVQYKQNGAFMYSKRYGTSYEAKVAAIHYLKSFGEIMLIVEDDVRLEFK